MPVFVPEDYEKIDPNEKKPFEPLPKGRYAAVIVKAGESKKAGQVEVQLDITDPEYAERKVWDYFGFTDANNWGIKRTKTVFDKLGIALKGGTVFDPAVLVGRAVFVDLVIDTYNPEKPKNKVEYDGYELIGAAVTEDEPF